MTHQPLMTVISGGKELCHLTFDFTKEHVPPTSREKVSYNMLLLKEASLSDLLRLTGLPEENVIDEIRWLRKEFGLRGNRRIGYSLSDDVEKRCAMSDAIDKMLEARRSSF